MFQREIGLTGAALLSSPSATLGGVDSALASQSFALEHRVPTFLAPAPDLRHAWQLVTLPESGDSDAAEIESIEPASGMILSRRRVASSAASVLLRVHMALFSGALGHLVILSMGLGVAVLAVSGFAISTRRLRSLFSNPLRAPDRWRSLHRWAGVTGAFLLLLWSSTGLILIGRVVLEDWSTKMQQPVMALHSELPLARIVDLANIVAPDELFGIGLPTSASRDIDVAILHRAAAPWRKYSHLHLDPRDGTVLLRTESGDESPWARVITAADSIHKGQSDLLAIHYAYALFVLFPVILVVSGPVTFLRRRWRSRRMSERHAAS